MPAVGEKSCRISLSRWAADISFCRSHADESVIAAPKPDMVW